MTIYLINIALLFAWACLLLWNKPNEAKRKAFCIAATAQWVLLSGLRDITVGADTYSYKVFRFDPLLDTPWKDVFSAFSNSYFGTAGIKDPGYLVVVKLLQLVTVNYQVFLFLIALMFTVPLGIFIYRRSPEPFMSFLIYSCLFSSFFAITGIRQTLATALVVLIGYQFIEQRRLLAFLAIALVAITIHKSAIVFVPFYFIAPQRTTRPRALGLLLAAGVVYVLRAPIMRFLGDAMAYEQYSEQYVGAGGAWVFTAMLVLVLGAALWRAPLLLKEHPERMGWYNAVFVALLFTPLTFVDPNAMRVVQYFSLFLMLLVPAILESFEDKHERALGYLLAFALLVALFVRTDPQYIFFWQGV